MNGLAKGCVPSSPAEPKSPQAAGWRSSSCAKTALLDPTEDLVGPFTDFADGLQKVDGFISKAWLQESDSVVGGFYLFRDTASVEAYLASDMVAELQQNPSFSDFQVRDFEILSELSARTGIPVAA